MPEEKKPGDGGAGDDDKKVIDKESEAPPKPITFKSQEDLDAIIEARVARAKPKDYDELVALRDKVKTEEDAKKTELQKEKDARKEAETKASEKDAKANAKLRKAAIIAEATSQGAVDIDIVTALLSGSEDIEVDEDGEVKGAKAAVKKLLDAKPILAKGKGPKTPGGEFGGNDPATLDEQIKTLEAAGKHSEARRLKIERGLAR